MFVDNGPPPRRYEDADGNCTHCEQSSKPDKITKLEFWKFQHKANVNKSALMKEQDLCDRSSGAQVISLAVALKSAENIRIYKLRQAKFNYPMLECS
jgi:hypothetical protein